MKEQDKTVEMSFLLKATSFSNFSIRTKLIVFFLVMSLIPVLVVGFLSLSNISHFSLNEKARVSLANLMSISNMIDDQLRIIQTESIRISQDDSILTLLESRQNNLHPAISFSAKSKLYRFNNYPEIHSIYLFSQANNTYTNQATSLIKLSDIENLEWYKNSIMSGKKIFFGEPLYLNRDVVIPYIRKITNHMNNKQLGLSMTNIYESTINRIYFNYGDILVLNKNGIIISSSDKVKIAI
jgi:hypothetical protein